MILTPGLLIEAGFVVQPNSNHCYIKDNIRVTFYSWEYMIVSVDGKSIRGENITIEYFIKEYGFSLV